MCTIGERGKSWPEKGEEEEKLRVFLSLFLAQNMRYIHDIPRPEKVCPGRSPRFRGQDSN